MDNSWFKYCLQAARIFKLWWEIIFITVVYVFKNVAAKRLPPHSLADSTAYSSAHFGQGDTIIIAIDDVACTGSEATLFSCAHSTSHNCVHSQDAGAQCVPRECTNEWTITLYACRPIALGGLKPVNKLVRIMWHTVNARSIRSCKSKAEIKILYGACKQKVVLV